MRTTQLLHNVKIDSRPQIVGNQIVVPLITDKPNNDISAEMTMKVVNDSDYSKLTLRNDDSKPTIVLQGSRFETAGKGQDRTILSSDVIESEQEKTVAVGCIQPSEGSHIDSGTEISGFIPASLRVPALEGKDDGHYNIIWDNIREYLDEVGVESDSLRDLYKQFQKELDEFVAQFENIDKQVGAVVLINNEVVGLELYPNYNSWRKVWRTLIRDSYGTDALKAIKKKTVITLRPNIDIDKVKNIDDIEKQVKNINIHNIKFLADKIEPLMNSEFRIDSTQQSGDFTINTVSNKSFKGQFITKNDVVVHCSLLKVHNILKNC